MRFVGFHRMAVLGVVLALAGCASKPPKPPKPTTLAGTIQASAMVNPSSSKRPSPLLIRVYELKSAATFNAADFMALYQRDQAELGADVLAREEYVLAPGEAKNFSKTLAPETRFVGVFAAYRDLEHSKWRTVVPVQPLQNQRLLIEAGELALNATVSPQAP
jgi:type VI secretion system protein VasD